MKVIVNIEEKKEKKKEQKPEFCNIISKKEGTISKIITKHGTPIIDINEHVNKGDILISGEIKLNEETKEHVCADGTIFAHTWYTINISIPKTYKTKTKGKKYRYNIQIKNNNKTSKIFKSRIKEPVIEEKYLFNVFGHKIYLLKEYTSSFTEKEYTNKEIENKINILVKEKLKPILINNNKIIKQNVLKKNDFNSTIDIELFIIVEEEISKQSYEIAKDDKEWIH